MRSKFLGISAVIKVYLMGEAVCHNTVYIPIPPIEKGIDSAVELLVDAVYEQVENAAYHRSQYIENLRLEIFMEGDFITGHYEKQFVYERESIASCSPFLVNHIKYCMVKVERDLSKKLADISRLLYE